MPIFNQHFVARTPEGTHAHSPDHIRHRGPIIQVQLGVPLPLAEWLQEDEQEVPSPVTVAGLIDTGASRTAVHLEIIERLGITAVGEVEVLSPNQRITNSIYPMHVRLLMGSVQAEMPSIPVIGSELSGQPIQALIGRDILSKSVFIYNGAGGYYTLAF